MHASLLLVLRLTQEHVDRAFRIARWYGRRTRRAEVSDLESAALEGLAKAARDWDPGVALQRKQPTGRKRSFWAFACTKILGEMRDELRRLDHLTRDQRALVTEGANGELAMDEESLSFINPQEPLPLDATVSGEDGEDARPIVELIEEPRNPIDDFELRDAFCRAGADLAERELFVVVKREIEGFSNIELAEAFDVTEGRASQLRGAALDQMRDQIGDSFLDAA
ncbi:MAG: sigma-70 family RNA polymerase sigma factor [Gaiellaceae bacterium]